MGIYMLSSEDIADDIMEVIEELEGEYTDKILKDALRLVLKKEAAKRKRQKT